MIPAAPSFGPTSAGDWKDVVVDLLPSQGSWSEDAYLWLTDQTSRLVELNDGCLEVLPNPTDLHQSIVQALFLKLFEHLAPLGGKVQFAPLRLRIGDGKFREPDLLVVKNAADPRRQNRFWIGADVVVEVLSPDRPKRDLDGKRREYAAAGIPEYWIVDPERHTIAILSLAGAEYGEPALFGIDAVAASSTLPGFCVSARDVFDVA
jgi:Uma2 family endonuclease